MYWVVIVVAIEQAMASCSGTAKLVESRLCWLRCLGIARHAREIRYADMLESKRQFVPVEDEDLINKVFTFNLSMIYTIGYRLNILPFHNIHVQ